MFDIDKYLNEPKEYYPIPRPDGSVTYMWLPLSERATRIVTEERLARLKEVTPRVPKVNLALENELFGCKWFAYRFIGPVEATELFADEYKRQYQLAWARTRDRDESRKKAGLAGDHKARLCGEEISLWRARQAADALGVRYDFFIRSAIEATIERGYKKLPRPNQLYQGGILETVGDSWNERVRGILEFSDIPPYRNESYSGHPAQDAHHSWLLEHVKKRRSDPHLIGRFCFTERLLLPALARTAFGDEKMTEAEACVAGRPAVPYEEPLLLDLHAACFAVPHARQADGGVCRTCPHNGLCAALGAEVKEWVIYHHGSDDPVADRRRAAVRERVRNLRRRRASGAPEA